MKLSEAQKAVLTRLAWFPDCVVAPEGFGCSQAEVDDLVSDGVIKRYDDSPVLWVGLTEAGRQALESENDHR